MQLCSQPCLWLSHPSHVISFWVLLLVSASTRPLAGHVYRCLQDVQLSEFERRPQACSELHVESVHVWCSVLGVCMHEQTSSLAVPFVFPYNLSLFESSDMCSWPDTLNVHDETF